MFLPPFLGWGGGYDCYWEKNKTQVVSLAVLGDESPRWRPTEYKYSRWGCELNFQFPVVKLLDYQQHRETLENDNNPFALVVLAYLSSKETRNNPQERLLQKFSLVRRLDYMSEVIVESKC